MQTETISLRVIRYRDKNDDPTCAVDFPAGKVCIFYRTSQFGCLELCGFAEEPNYLHRRDNQQGTLIPHVDCPLFTGEEVDDAMAP